MRQTHSATFNKIVFTMVISALSLPVHAGSSIDLQHFVPAVGGHDFLTAFSAEVNPHLGLSSTAVLTYGHNLLQVSAINPDTNVQQNVGSIVSNRVDLNLGIAIGILRQAELGLLIPLVWQNGFASKNFSASQISVGTKSIPSVTQGDLRIIPKLNLFNIDKGLFAAALIPALTLPTANKAAYTGEASATFMPMLALSSRFDKFRAALDAGYLFRQATKLNTISIGNEAVFKAALAYNLSDSAKEPFEIIGEVFGSSQAEHLFGSGTSGLLGTYQKSGTPIEADAAIRFGLSDLYITAGGGSALSTGYGAPNVRLFVSAVYYTGKTSLPDKDGDGVPDIWDKCPDEPGDGDNSANDDGCLKHDKKIEKIPEDNTIDDIDNIVEEKAEPDLGNTNQHTVVTPPPAPIKQPLVVITKEKIELKESVYFKKQKSIIDPRSFNLLNQVATLLNQAQYVTRIRIEGHTDNEGPRSRNIKLSQERAQAVKNYLVKKGVASKRLYTVGYGPDKPIASNKIEAGKQKNRRVEMVIVEQKSVPATKPSKDNIQFNF